MFWVWLLNITFLFLQVKIYFASKQEAFLGEHWSIETSQILKTWVSQKNAKTAEMMDNDGHKKNRKIFHNSTQTAWYLVVEIIKQKIYYQNQWYLPNIWILDNNIFLPKRTLLLYLYDSCQIVLEGNLANVLYSCSTI